jgi:ATP-binding cassette, subfamily B, bacterial MsbA
VTAKLGIWAALRLGAGRASRGVSVGQKQRISIAADLFKNAPVLFLDEATSNLDSVSERKVQAAIDRLMEVRTTFVIAHRMSTLRRASRLVVFDEGDGLGSRNARRGVGKLPDVPKPLGHAGSEWRR